MPVPVCPPEHLEIFKGSHDPAAQESLLARPEAKNMSGVLAGSTAKIAEYANRQLGPYIQQGEKSGAVRCHAQSGGADFA